MEFGAPTNLRRSSERPPLNPPRARSIRSSSSSRAPDKARPASSASLISNFTLSFLIFKCPSSDHRRALACSVVPSLLFSEISAPLTAPRSQDSMLRPSQKYAAAWLPSTATAIAPDLSSVCPAYTTFLGNLLSSALLLALVEVSWPQSCSPAGRGLSRWRAPAASMCLLLRRAGAGRAGKHVHGEHDDESHRHRGKCDQGTAMLHGTSSARRLCMLGMSAPSIV